VCFVFYLFIFVISLMVIVALVDFATVAVAIYSIVDAQLPLANWL